MTEPLRTDEDRLRVCGYECPYTEEAHREFVDHEFVEQWQHVALAASPEGLDVDLLVQAYEATDVDFMAGKETIREFVTRLAAEYARLTGARP